MLSQSENQRPTCSAAAWVWTFLLVLALLFVAGCDGSAGAGDTPNSGGVTAHAIWPASGSGSAPQSFFSSPFNSGNPLPPSLATVMMTVSAADISPSISQSFAAAARAGQVNNVPAGTNRTLTLQGYNAGSQLLYQGSVGSITVDPGIVTDAGDVTMSWVFSLPPGTLSITGPGDPYVSNSAGATLTGTCTSDPPNTIQLTGAITDSFPCSSGTFSRAVSLGGSPTEGDHVTTVSQVDDYTGDVSQSLNWTWTYDITPPGSFSLGSPATLTNNLSTITITGSCEDGATVYLTDVTGAGLGDASQVCSGSSFSIPFSKSTDNTYQVDLTETDAAGNTNATTLTVNWTRDATPPAAPVITTPAASPVVLAASNLTIGGTCEPGAQVDLVDVTDAGAANDSQTCTVGGTFSFDVNKIINGLYTFSLTQTDAVGNVSAAANQQWIRGTPQFVVTPTSLSASEGGTPQTFNVSVNTPPNGDVVVDVFSSDTTEATVDKSSLTFNSGNWSTAQTVTVTPKTDGVADGNQTATIVLALNGGSTTDTSGYASLDPANVSMTVLDINGVGITVTPQSGLTVTEDGTQQATFTVVLNSAPNNDVVIDVVSTDTTEASVDKSTLTFTTGNWNSAQTVTITGVDDALVDGSQTVTIALTINSGSTLDTSGYAALNPPDVTVTNIDDDAPSFTVTPTSGLLVSEAGNATSFSVVLNTMPNGNVTVNVVSLDTTEVVVNKATLLFTTSDWFTPQTVTVTGVDDALDDGNQAITIALTINAGGTTDTTGYATLNPPDVQVTNSDDDTAGFTVVPTSTLTTEAGGVATFSVSLNTQPAAGKVVVINVTSLDTTEVTVDKAQLTFTESDWATPQVVTATGVDDAAVDGNQTVTVQLAIDGVGTTDAGYQALNPPDVSIVNTDDDVAGVTVTPTSLTVSETGSSATFSVRLNTLPSGDVVILVQNGDTSEISVDKSTLTFTPSDWQTAQIVTVNGVADALADGNQVVNVALITDTLLTTDSNYDAVDPPDVLVTNIDNTPAVTVTPTSGLSTSETGTTASFTVRLNTQPQTGTVVKIDLLSGDTNEVTVDKSQLTFDEFDWSTPQTVVLTGVDDGNPDGSQLVTISLTMNGGTTDTDYAVIDPPDVTVTNADDEVIQVNVTPTSGLITTEGGASDTFTVSLSSLPTGNVVIDILSLDTSETTVDKAQLTFTTSDWLTPQTVTVKGVNDTATDGDQAVTIQITMNGSTADANYAVLDPDDVSVTNQDNEPSSEGSSGAPVNITGSLPYGGSNASGESSYYKITGLAANTQYFITISSLINPSILYVYSDSGFSTLECTGNQNSGDSRPKSCYGNSNGSGELYIRVANNAGASGSTYRIDITLPPADEGTVTPVDLTGLLPYTLGQVGSGSSYYMVTGLPVGVSKLVKMTNLTQNIDLFVYSDSGFSSLLCSSSASTIAESCAATVPGSGTLYFEAQLQSGSGATYYVDVTDPPVNQGTSGSPVDITGQLPYAGTLLSGASYYVLTGLTPGTVYTVLMTEVTGGGGLEVYTDSGFSTLGCSSNGAVNLPESCQATANPSGKLYIRTHTPTSAGGTTYNLRAQ